MVFKLTEIKTDLLQTLEINNLLSEKGLKELVARLQLKILDLEQQIIDLESKNK
jgi:hypothetical protein